MRNWNCHLLTKVLSLRVLAAVTISCGLIGCNGQVLRTNNPKPVVVPEEAKNKRGVKNTTITHVSVDLDGNVAWVRSALDVPGKPSSCVNDKNIFAIDPSTPEGRAALAVVLSAASEAKKVDLYGTGRCNPKVKNDAEELSAVLIIY